MIKTKAEVREIIDIGCGPANSTAVLAERFPMAHITGADNSADMLKRAAFEREVLEEVKKEYPPQQNGEIIFRFPRLLFTAVRDGR